MLTTTPSPPAGLEPTRRPDAVLIGRCKVCRTGIRRTMRPVLQRTARSIRCRYLGQDGQAYPAALDSFTDGAIVVCACGHSVHLKVLRGTRNADKRCDARCMSATGPSCECACGGANHGAGHEAVA